MKTDKAEIISADICRVVYWYCPFCSSEQKHETHLNPETTLFESAYCTHCETGGITLDLREFWRQAEPLINEGTRVTTI